MNPALLFYAWFWVSWFCMIGCFMNLHKYAADAIRLGLWLRERRPK